LPTDRSTAGAGSKASDTVGAWVIDTPPLDGLISAIAVVATDEALGELELDAVNSTSIGGTGLIPDPQESDYAVGLYDTGASAHVMGHGAATDLGVIGAGLLTSSTVTITGVTGSVDAWVSWPLGLYMDGLDAVDPDTLLLDTTNMMGQYNASIAVGPEPAPEQPDLPTAIGSPMAAYYTAWFEQDQIVTLTRDSETYTAPRISFYPWDEPSPPNYANLVPLELRPMGGIAVQYTPCLDVYECPEGFGAPSSPSVIAGTSALQSLFFVSSVDLYEQGKSAIDKDRFMLDTGAQVSVVGYRVGARLGLDPANPEFMVPIQGVDGTTVMEPGFTIDRIDIPALGEWLSFRDVPVVLLEINSPEGGTLDGIIGMNLMTEVNFVLHGGGLVGQPAPSLEYEVIVPDEIDADFDDDGDVDQTDFGHLQACFTGPETVQEEVGCQDALLDADNDVDDADVAVFNGCANGANVPASDACTASQ
jgi:predicted aspartyl protease